MHSFGGVNISKGVEMVFEEKFKSDRVHIIFWFSILKGNSYFFLIRLCMWKEKRWRYENDEKWSLHIHGEFAAE